MAFIRVFTLALALSGFAYGNIVTPYTIETSLTSATNRHSGSSCCANTLTAKPGPLQSVGRTTSFYLTSKEDVKSLPGTITRGFRRKVTSPDGKCALCASVLITAGESYNLFINGHKIGSGGGTDQAKTHFTALCPSSNLFAVRSTIHPHAPRAGPIATIVVHYSDGTTETVISDARWETIPGADPPQDFASPRNKDSRWTFAPVFPYDPSHPWGEPKIPPALSFSGVHWVWTGEGHVSGSRGFRKTVSSRKTAVCATIVVASDGQYTLYSNGQTVGSGSGAQSAGAFMIPNLQPRSNVLAIKVSNGGGLIASMVVMYADGSTEMVRTDTTWKTYGKREPPAGFEIPKLDDRKWERVSDVGSFETAKWGTGIAIPTV